MSIFQFWHHQALIAASAKREESRIKTKMPLGVDDSGPDFDIALHL